MAKINVYSDEHNTHEVIGRVNLNKNLDYWDGNNYLNHSAGWHKGITKLKNGEFVIIISTDWIGQKDYAFIVNEKRALNEILEANKIEMLDEKRFEILKRRYENEMLLEEETEE